MIGAIVGDIAGSRFEWHNRKSKQFTLMKGRSESRHPCCFTDDTVMTLALAEAILKWREGGGGSYAALSEAAIRHMQDFGRRYPGAGYGSAFRHWLRDDDPQPYNSWGNGSAMRVSACGWAGRTLDEVKAMSRAVTEVTHNHPEGIKGAEAVASVIWAARNGWSKDRIRKYVEKEFYPLKKTCDQIRPTYHFDVSCQGTVPQAITAFLEGDGFEDVIRTAVSLGGDCDTLTCIAGGMAEAMYGVPEELKEECRRRLEPDMVKVLERFDMYLGRMYERQ